MDGFKMINDVMATIFGCSTAIIEAFRAFYVEGEINMLNLGFTIFVALVYAGTYSAVVYSNKAGNHPKRGNRDDSMLPDDVMATVFGCSTAITEAFRAFYVEGEINMLNLGFTIFVAVVYAGTYSAVVYSNKAGNHPKRGNWDDMSPEHILETVLGSSTRNWDDMSPEDILERILGSSTCVRRNRHNHPV